MQLAARILSIQPIIAFHINKTKAISNVKIIQQCMS